MIDYYLINIKIILQLLLCIFKSLKVEYKKVFIDYIIHKYDKLCPL